MTAFVRNGSRVWIYDGAENTVRTGEGVPEQETPDEEPVTPTEVNRLLDELAPTNELSQQEPVEVAGRQAYVLVLSPRDEGATLVDRAQMLVDSETTCRCGSPSTPTNAPTPCTPTRSPVSTWAPCQPISSTSRPAGGRGAPSPRVRSHASRNGPKGRSPRR